MAGADARVPAVPVFLLGIEDVRNAWGDVWGGRRPAAAWVPVRDAGEGDGGGELLAL